MIIVLRGSLRQGCNIDPICLMGPKRTIKLLCANNQGHALKDKDIYTVAHVIVITTYRYVC